MNPKFKKSVPVNLTINNTQVDPYDPNYRYNRIVYTPKYDNAPPSAATHSVDFSAFYHDMYLSKLDNLSRISLICRENSYNPSELYMWDTVATIAMRGLGGAVFVGGKDFKPADHSQVEVSNLSLNRKQYAFRSHLSRITEKDTIGICVSSLRSGVSYILFYKIDSFSRVLVKTEKGDYFAPVANCSLHHVINITPAGSTATSAEGEEYNEEILRPFAECLLNSATDPATSYPWKPHFQAMALAKYDYTKITNYISSVKEAVEKEDGSVVFCTYDEFEDACRDFYVSKVNYLREKTPTAKKFPVGRSPMITVSRIGDLYICAVGRRGEETTYCFDADSIGIKKICEPFLMGEDVSESNVDMLTLEGHTPENPIYYRVLKIEF